MEIRPIRGEDEAAASGLILSGLGEHFGRIDPSMNPDLDDIKATYQEAGHDFYVIESAGRVVGTGALLRESKHVGRIARVTVDPKHRRRGVGAAMVDHLLQRARQLGMRTVLVETNLDWHEAIRLYLAQGFQEYDRDDVSVHLRLGL